jgi:hypothetical protein
LPKSGIIYLLTCFPGAKHIILGPECRQYIYFTIYKSQNCETKENRLLFEWDSKLGKKWKRLKILNIKAFNIALSRGHISHNTNMTLILKIEAFLSKL